MSRSAFEINLDGLVGPTHHYGGLSMGNLASQQHGFTESNPREAVHQGLRKMKLLMDLGIRQAVLPPHDRPDLEALRGLGFEGSDAQLLQQAHRHDPHLVAACHSASAMWAANAATVSPSADTGNGRVHITPANLISQYHRSLEPPITSTILKAIFSDERYFVHHAPLPASIRFSDEGAANAMRLCMHHGAAGIEIFVYGASSESGGDDRPQRFPARQSREAANAIARIHRLDPERTILLQQNPAAIDSGVFHNDVAGVSNENVLFHHAEAFRASDKAIETIEESYCRSGGEELIVVQVTASEIPLSEAVDTYLFNSQLVTRPDGAMVLICPVEAQESPASKRCLERLQAGDNPITDVRFIDVRQSMKNGGGPACMRLRVVLTQQEYEAAHQGVMLDDDLYQRLQRWADRHYRDRLRPDDLTDPQLLIESRAALDELTSLLGLGSIYPYQRSTVP
jgi:succinylarginine dihydrolase